MLCQCCGERPVTTRIKTIVNGRLTERALCAVCAQRLGYTSLLTHLDRGFGSVFSDCLEGNACRCGTLPAVRRNV